MAVCSIWLSVVLPFFGVKIGLLNQNGSPTSIGVWVASAVLFLLFLYTLCVNLFSIYREKTKKESLEISNDILDHTNNMINERVYDHREHFRRFIEKKIDVNLENHDVDRRIANIIGELHSAIMFGFKIQEEIQVSVTLVYRFDEEKGTWIERDRNFVNPDDIKEAKELIENPMSFGYYIYKTQVDNLAYLNDKRRGISGFGTIKKPSYIENERDREYAKKKRRRSYGSIVGHKFHLDIKQQTYIEAILFISTYGIKLDRSIFERKQKQIIAYFKKIILPPFISEMEQELICLYIMKSKERLEQAASKTVS
jgi:hypothetical protein